MFIFIMKKEMVFQYLYFFESQPTIPTPKLYRNFSLYYTRMKQQNKTSILKIFSLKLPVTALKSQEGFKGIKYTYILSMIYLNNKLAS